MTTVIGGKPEPGFKEWKEKALAAGLDKLPAYLASLGVEGFTIDDGYAYMAYANEIFLWRLHALSPDAAKQSIMDLLDSVASTCMDRVVASYGKPFGAPAGARRFENPAELETLVAEMRKGQTDKVEAEVKAARDFMQPDARRHSAYL